jgi:hypothetical protein
MRNHITHISAAMALAAFAVACGGRNDTVNNDRRNQGGGNRGVNERVSLRGCVQPAVTGQGGYALRHVVADSPAEQPQGQETMEHPLIARGSWVYLAAGKGMTDDLKSYVNNEVTITGEIIDTGQNTIGTAGHEGGTPQEQMPATSSVANGNAPKIAVEKVHKIAENCAGE